MASALVPLIDGFEETEAVAVIDVLRRAGVHVTTAGVGKLAVTGSHQITVQADSLFSDARKRTFDAIVLPGGPGCTGLNMVEGFHTLLRAYAAEGKLVAAICAAPTVLAAAGLLDGKRATCFPGCEKDLGAAERSLARVVEDGNFITSRAMGTAIEFGLAVAARLAGQAAADKVAKAILQPKVEAVVAC